MIETRRSGAYSLRVKHAARRGYALVDTMLALTIGSIMFSDIVIAQSDLQARNQAMSIARALSDVEKPVRAYIDQNYQSLMTIVPVNTTIAVPWRNDQNWQGIGDVVSSSILPTTWSPSLPMNQTMQLLVRHVAATSRSPEHLASMVIASGGNPMTDRQVGIAMSTVTSGMAGGILKNSHGGTKSSIQGLSGAWKEDVSQWTGGTPLTYGHVGLYLNAVQSTAPYLNRYNIGNTESNRLHTSVDVNSNDLDNIRTLTGVNTMRISSTPYAVNALGGINTCLNNAAGCGVSISDDGGFYDENDGWITLKVSGGLGLHIEGPRGLLVDNNGEFGGGLATNGNTANSGTGCELVFGPTSNSSCLYADSANVAIRTADGGDATLSAATANHGVYTQDGLGNFVPLVTDFVQPMAGNITAGQPCGWQSQEGQIHNGGITSDVHGHIMSCVDGVWTMPGATLFSAKIYDQYSGQYYSGSYSNTTSYPVFVQMLQTGGQVRNSNVQASIDGGQICNGQASSGKSASFSYDCGTVLLPNKTINYFFGEGGHRIVVYGSP